MDRRLPASPSSLASKGNFLLLASTERQLEKNKLSELVKMDLLHSQSCCGAARLFTRVLCIFYELFLIAAARVQTLNRTQAD